MRMKWQHAALVVGIAAACAAQAEEKKFVIDPVHSGLTFRIRHLYTMFPGRMDSFSGTITCDTNDLTTIEINATVDTASVSTGNADRDKHLRSADFFNVAKYPGAMFESTEVVSGPDNTLTIRGTITICGIEAAMTFEGTILGYGPDPKGGTRVGFHGEGTIDRTKFGIAYNAALSNGVSVLGNDVQLGLDIEAVEVDTLPGETAKPLAAQMDALKSDSGTGLARGLAAALDEARAAIAAQQSVDGLKIGDKAPDFTLPDTSGREVTLSGEIKKGSVVLVFYRGEWCPFCNLQLRALETAYPQMRELGASLLAVSPQKIDKALEQQNRGALSFPLLSDTRGDTLRAYKLLYTIPEDMKQDYKQRFGLDLEEYNGPGHWELPVTATYIIDRDGVIRAGMVDVDYTKRMEPDDIISALKALKK